MKFHQINYLIFPFKVGMKVRWSIDVIKNIDDIGTVVALSPSFFCCTISINNKHYKFHPMELEIIKLSRNKMEDRRQS